MDIEFFEVGGCVRDALLGIKSKDVDFAVVAPSFDAMVSHLTAEGFKLHQVVPQFCTVRAGVPDGHALRERTRDADFVLCRADGPSSDGRRPDFVRAGTLLDDLRRRDFTVNAIARATDGTLIDPFDGVGALKNRELRFVGSAMDRISEDGLRVVRGLRFVVTRDLTPTPATWVALNSPLAAEMLTAVATERIRDELERMFAHDTLSSLEVLSELRDEVRNALFPTGLRLSATMRA